MPWYGVNHVHAVTDKPEETIDFYTDVMGFDLVRRNQRPNGKSLSVFTDGTYNKLYFFEIDEEEFVHPLQENQQAMVGERMEEEGLEPEDVPYTVGFHHVAWGVESEEELKTIKEHFDKHDVPNWGPINRSNFAYNLYFEDPNGLNLEIHSPGPLADSPGSFDSSDVASSDLPGTNPNKEEVENVEKERGGILKEGAEDGIAKRLSSSFWEKT